VVFEYLSLIGKSDFALEQDNKGLDAQKRLDKGWLFVYNSRGRRCNLNDHLTSWPLSLDVLIPKQYNGISARCHVTQDKDAIEYRTCSSRSEWGIY